MRPMQKSIDPKLCIPARSHINYLYFRCSTGYCLRVRVFWVRVWGQAPCSVLLILPHGHSLCCKCSTGYCLRSTVIEVRVWGQAPYSVTITIFYFLFINNSILWGISMTFIFLTWKKGWIYGWGWMWLQYNMKHLARCYNS